MPVRDPKRQVRLRSSLEARTGCGDDSTEREAGGEFRRDDLRGLEVDE